MTRHMGAEALARLRQGDLSPRRNRRLRAHLAGCARCRDLDADLAGVSTLLAGAQPPPMPEHLAARIQTALAAEAALRSARMAGVTGTSAQDLAGQAGHDDVTERSVPDRRWSRDRRRPSGLTLRVAAAAAAAVVVGGGIYGLVQASGGQNTASSGSAAIAPQTGANGAGSGVKGAPSLGPMLQYRRDGHLATFTPVTTGTNFMSGQLGRQAAADLVRFGPGGTGRAGPNALHNPGAESVPGPAQGPALAVLAGCVSRIAAGHQVLLVEIARYQGHPATVIMTRTAAGEQVWVAGPGCSATRSDLLRHTSLTAGG